nr:hypothetical protein A4A49_08704 [Ipomoea trifida]
MEMEKKNSNVENGKQCTGDHQHLFVHSQVKKIRQQESERNIVESWLPGDTRTEVMTRQHSRSRLGLMTAQAVSVAVLVMEEGW